MLTEAGFLFLLGYLVWRNGESWQILGFRPTRWWIELIWAFVLYCALWLSSLCVTSLAKKAGWEPGPKNSPEETAAGSYAALLPVFLIVSALFEEILLRGYLWNRIEQFSRRPAVALLSTSLLFAAYHPYSMLQVLEIFVFGLVLGVFYWHGRSLPRLVLAHFAYNIAIFYLIR